MTEVLAIESLRPVLIRHAYYVLGTIADAEDIVQDAFLQWTTTDTEKVENPRSYLMRTVTNLAINLKKRQKRQQAAYFGQWLPEPLASEQADHTINRNDRISYSLMVMLERLSAKERAVFILREAFDYDHQEIAEALEISPANSRKLLSRAKSRIGSIPNVTPTLEEQTAFLDRFLHIIRKGNTEALESILREDVIARSDGGGKVSAGKHPVCGRGKVLRMLLGLYRKFYHRLLAQPLSLCGQPAMGYWEANVLVTCQVFTLHDGKLQEVYFIRNPDKLAHLQKNLVNVSHNTQANCLG